MWPSFRGECDPCFCVAGAIVSEPQKDFFHPREWYSRVFHVPTAISTNFQDTMHAMVFHCYVVTSISSNFQDALDVTFQETFQSTSRTLWMLRCKIQFEQLGRHFGCYVPTAIWINFQHTMDATLYYPVRATWKKPRMLRSNSHFNQLPGHYACYGAPLLRCNIHLEQLRRRFGCYLPRDISINF